MAVLKYVPTKDFNFYFNNNFEFLGAKKNYQIISW